MVNFILEKNKETNSLCKIKFNDTEIPLNEEDLQSLVNQIHHYRPDTFEDIDEFESITKKLEDLEERCNTLDSDLDRANDKISELEGILDDNEIDYL